MFQDPRIFGGLTVLENALAGARLRANHPWHAICAIPKPAQRMAQGRRSACSGRLGELASATVFQNRRNRFPSPSSVS